MRIKSLPFLIFIGLVSIAGCASNNDQAYEQLAAKHCASCHQLPRPSELNKISWSKYVLPQMGGFLGFRLFEGGTYFEDERIDPIMTAAQWDSIVRYYISNAPDTLLAPGSLIQADMNINGFAVSVFPYRKPESATTLIRITKDHRLFFGDGVSEQLYLADSSLLTVRDSIPAAVGLSSMIYDSAAVDLLSMGVLTPSDAVKGELRRYSFTDRRSLVLIDSLQRPVDMKRADLNGDALADYVICEFGNRQGRLAWYEQHPGGFFVQHILRPLPGAVHVEVRDINKDGLPDLLVLMAQGDEGMFLYYNHGGGKFREERLLQFSPAFGSNYFELADINRDGFIDIIATNGDNGDYPPVLKPYHGIRIYLNDRSNHFVEKQFIPLNGASKVLVRDFDNDGDDDLATIAFFADYVHHPEQAFLLWMNTGNLMFKPFSFPNVGVGRWLTMDANDLDGDGDLDIVLGNANFSMGNIPQQYKDKWNNNAPSVMVLRNKSR